MSRNACKKFIPALLSFVILTSSALACNLPSETVDEIAEGLAETELFVAATGDDANDCQTPESACASLHRAAAVANLLTFAAIRIGAGTYNEAEPVRIDVPTILSGEGEVVINNIDAPNPFGEDPVIAVNLSAPGAVRLENIRLQNGAGIRIINGGLELVNVRMRNLTPYAVFAIEFTDEGHNLRSNILIENSEINNITGNAILTTGANIHTRILSTTISDTSETAIINREGSVTMDGVRIFNARGVSGYPSAILNANRFFVGTSGSTEGGLFRITNSAIYGNTAEGDAAIRSSGRLEISNSTVSSNTGQGVFVGRFSDAILTHVTIASNSEVGLIAPDVPNISVSLVNSLVVYNQRDCDLRITYESIPSPDRNQNTNTIDSDNTCIEFQAAERAAWDFYPGVDSALNGEGVHPLETESPAVDAVDCILPTDQRGVARPQGSLCDIGAYELESTLGEPLHAPTSTPLALVHGTTTASATLPSVPAQISASATPSSSFVRVNTDANCRSGPNTVYSIITGLKAGTEVPAIGRNENNSWWWVLIDGGQHCWISASLVEAFGPVSSLPLISAPPTPAPSPTLQAPANTATTAPQPPSAPVQLFYENVVCNGQAYNISLRWTDTSSNEQGFRVYRNGALITTLGANSTQHTDSPPFGGPYTYAVEAYNSAGTSAQATVTEPGCIP